MLAAIHKTVAALRIFGESLDPDEITKLLGKKPTAAERKGDVRQKSKFVVKQGSWRLRASDQSPEDINKQIFEILDGLTNNLSVWNDLVQRFKVDLFCGLFMKGSNEGVTLSSQSLKLLGDRGIELGLDVYAPVDD